MVRTWLGLSGTDRIILSLSDTLLKTRSVRTSSGDRKRPLYIRLHLLLFPSLQEEHAYIFSLSPEASDLCYLYTGASYLTTKPPPVDCRSP